MINPGSQIPEPSPVTHFVILPHADKELTARDVEAEGELIYQLIISTQLPASAFFCLIIFSLPRERDICAPGYVCELWGQVPAKGLPGFMGGLELARGA